MRASILIVGHPFPEKIEFGADHCASYDDGFKTLQANKYAVLVAADSLPVLDSSKIKSSLSFLKKSRTLNAETQTILVSSDVSPRDLQKAINEFGLFKTIPSFDSGSLQQAVREALEEYELIKQNEAFLALTQEQNYRLHTLSVLLEEKVKAREKFLAQSREDLLQATRKTEALNRALVAVQKSLTVQEMELQLKNALQAIMGLDWIRILLKDEPFIDHVGNKKTISLEIFSAPLLRDHDLLGHIYFAREKAKPFQTEEDDFLLQVTDTVALAIDRLTTIDAIETMKQEWDSTFDAITQPVAIVDESYNLVRANVAYSKRAQTPLDEISGKKCHEVLFGRKTPCENCRLGQNFVLETVTPKDKVPAHFSVTSHRIEGRGNYALFYQDTIEEERIQRQILESSKMAEIGTIGSSIAHEINNPLGGMIAFLQILKNDLAPDDKIFPDVVEMEKAAIRCKTIVENLLAFTRQSSSEKQKARLGEIIKIVCNIMELQTRSLGIEIERKIHDNDAQIQADPNQIVQVLVNVMQNSCEAIASRMSSGKRLPAGKIVLSSSQTADGELCIDIADNGTGISHKDLSRVFTPFFTTKDSTRNPGLGLSVSYQIMKEHGGNIEISSELGQFTSVQVRFKADRFSSEQKEAAKGPKT